MTYKASDKKKEKRVPVLGRVLINVVELSAPSLVNKVLTETLIKGLDPKTKNLHESTAGQHVLEKTYVELFTHLNKISQGNPKWNKGGANPIVQKTCGMLEVDVVTIKIVQLVAMENMRITDFNNISLGQQPTKVNVLQHPPIW